MQKRQAEFAILRSALVERGHAGHMPTRAVRDDNARSSKAFEQGAMMNDHDAILAIAKLMDGTEWDSDTLEGIAEIMWQAGHCVRDIDDEEKV